jgi:hypothetical protein
MSIQLHPTKGINPHVTFCVQCGVDVGIALIGNRDKKRTCDNCDTVNYGAKASDSCGKCGLSLRTAKAEEIREGERLPGGLCNDCQAEQKEHREIVEQGGVYWKCRECTLRGVIKPSPFAEMVREQLGTPTPQLCGVEFEHCIEHSSGE